MSVQRLSSWCIPVLAGMLWSGPSAGQELVPDQPAGWLVRAGTLWSDGDGFVAGGEVLLRDGTIAAVGPDLEAPDDVEVIDVTDGFILPGLIEAHSQTGLHGDGVGWDTDEDTRPITADLHARDAFYAFAADVASARRSGITTVLATPGGKNLIGGSGVLIKTAPAVGDENVVRQPAVLKMSLGDEPKRTNAAPRTRMGEVALLREHLSRARKYEEERNQAEQNGERPAVDADFETTAALLRGELPALVQAYTTKDIANALRLSDEFGFDVILAYATQAHLIAGELARRDVPVVLASIKGLWYRYEKESFSERNAAQLLDAGVRIALQLGEGNPYGGGDLLFNAGYLLKHGLAREDALRAITSWPAELLGVADRLGRLRPGMDGDVVVLSGPPFDPRSQVLHVFINGQRMPSE